MIGIRWRTGRKDDLRRARDGTEIQRDTCRRTSKTNGVDATANVVDHHATEVNFVVIIVASTGQRVVAAANKSVASIAADEHVGARTSPQDIICRHRWSGCHRRRLSNSTGPCTADVLMVSLPALPQMTSGSVMPTWAVISSWPSSPR